MFLYLVLVPLLLWLFIVGAAVGSFLNVCIYRLPLGKGIVWPGSRCGHCFHEVRLKDNIPLVSYWVLRGRCRDCGAPFSMRYFWVELLTAVTFVTLYLLEIGCNVQQLPIWSLGAFNYFEWGMVPPTSWELFVFHIALACFLIIATACLIDRGRIPAAIVISGTVTGLIGAIFFPWPYPHEPATVLDAPSRAGSLLLIFKVDGGAPGQPLRWQMPVDASWADGPVSPRPGFYAWPVWGPLPDDLAPGTWPLGLLTGLAGALAGGWGVRFVAMIARRGANRNVVPACTAGLAMIAGAFLGWQPVLVAVVLALTMAAPFLLRRRQFFTPGLVVAIVAVWLGWAWIGPVVRPVLFNPLLLPALLATGLALLYVVCLLMRLSTAPPSPGA